MELGFKAYEILTLPTYEQHLVKCIIISECGDVVDRFSDRSEDLSRLLARVHDRWKLQPDCTLNATLFTRDGGVKSLDGQSLTNMRKENL